MNVLPKIDILEATRLTREGRLKEAMAVLRGKAAGSAASTSPDPSGTARSNIPDHGLLQGLVGRGAVFGRQASNPLSKLKPHCEPIQVVAGARFEARSYSDATGSRDYKLYVPSRYVGQALPLVVMLHGCTQSPDDFAAGTRMNDLAEEQMFLVAYPEQSQSANVSKCWNWFNANDQRRDQGEPSLIAGITLEIIREFCVERSRVYVAGLSAGGAAAAIMGSAYPDIYAAIGVHSGLACGAAHDLPSAFSAMRQGGSMPNKASRSSNAAGFTVPAIVFHGDQDRTVNPLNSDLIIAQSPASTELRAIVTRGKTSAGMRYTRTVREDENARPMLEQWVLHGAGHAWSGGSSSGSYTEPRGPDASREIIRFFFQHSAAASELVYSLA